MDNEKLKEFALQNGQEIVSWVKEIASKTGDFVARETPILAKEIVNWHIASNGIGAICGFIVLGVIAYFLKRLFNRFADLYERREDGTHSTGFLIGSLLFLSIFILPISIVLLSETVKGIVAPRLVLIEYASQFVK